VWNKADRHRVWPLQPECSLNAAGSVSWIQHRPVTTGTSVQVANLKHNNQSADTLVYAYYHRTNSNSLTVVIHAKEKHWERGGKAPRILYLRTRCRWVTIFTIRTYDFNDKTRYIRRTSFSIDALSQVKWGPKRVAGGANGLADSVIPEHCVEITDTNRHCA
jgi:hypothetical protein